MTDANSSDAPEPAQRGRRRAVVWGVVFGYSSVAFALLRNILLVPLYLASISLSEYGAWLATGGALVQLLITDFGLSGALTQRISVLVGARRWAELGPTLGAGIAASLGLCAALTAVGVLAAPFVPLFDSLDQAAAARVIACFRLSIITAGLSIVAATFVGALRSFQNSLISGACVLTAEALGIAVTVLMLREHLGLYAIAYGLLARSVILVVATGVALRSEVGRLGNVHFSVQKRFLRTLVGDSFYLFVASIAMKLQTQANTVVVAYLLGPSAAAIYGLTTRAHETVLALLSQVTTAIVPSMAHLYGSGNLVRFREVTERLLPVLAAAVIGAMAVTVACNRAFVSLWVGSSLYAGDPVSVLMAAAGCLSVIGYVAYDGLLAKGEFRTIALVYTFTGVLHLIALAVLTRFGLWGAPLATLISAAVWSTLFWRRLSASWETTSSAGSRLRRSVLTIAATGCVVAGIGVIVRAPLTDTWMHFGARTVLCSGVAVLLLLLTSPVLRRLTGEELRSTIRARQ